MLKRYSEIKGLRLQSVDCEMGKVSDLLIDDSGWNVRYLVVSINLVASINEFLSTRRVLISPAAIEGYDFDLGMVATGLSSQQVLHSPPVDLERPISRQYEIALVDHYGWPIYWLGRVFHGSAQAMDRMAEDGATAIVEETDGMVNLRSANEICGYRIDSRDGFVGFAKDLVIHMDSWKVEYASADADPSSLFPSENAMFSANKIKRIDWTNQQMQVDLAKETIQGLTRRSAPTRSAE